MTNLIASLRSLPPKQALILAMAEKTRRTKHRQQRELALATAYSNTELSPTYRDVPSLVLNRDHVLSDLYYKQAPYKVYWGGRGSAKSWGFAEALIRKAAAAPLRVLCTREYQNSIRDSSHRILADTIVRLGLESWFTVTAESIKSRTGSEFMFKGLHGNEEGIKSTEGVDICWVEEAQTVSARSWQTLLPTVRKEGSEVWVSYNLISEDDATHKLFVVHGRTGAIVHKLNYDSNPYFGGKLRQDMEDDKAVDFHLYEHIWLGMPLRVSNAMILGGKYVVEDFDADLWREAERRRLGLDFGFSQDPLALISMFVLDNTLYIERECYGTGIELDDIPARFDADVPEAREWPIKADSSRPETISYLRRMGFTISGADKWEGCVRDGITHMRRYRRIVIHPRCENTAREARLWSYKVDRNQVDDKGQPMVLPIVVQKHDHTWDGVRYGLDGEIQRSGTAGLWARLGADPMEPGAGSGASVIQQLTDLTQGVNT
jgi:phage terminase large subunit